MCVNMRESATHTSKVQIHITEHHQRTQLELSSSARSSRRDNDTMTTNRKQKDDHSSSSPQPECVIVFASERLSEQPQSVTEIFESSSRRRCPAFRSKVIRRSQYTALLDLNLMATQRRRRRRCRRLCSIYRVVVYTFFTACQMGTNNDVHFRATVRYRETRRHHHLDDEFANATLQQQQNKKKRGCVNSSAAHNACYHFGMHVILLLHACCFYLDDTNEPHRQRTERVELSRAVVRMCMHLLLLHAIVRCTSSARAFHLPFTKGKVAIWAIIYICIVYVKYTQLHRLFNAYSIYRTIQARASRRVRSREYVVEWSGGALSVVKPIISQVSLHTRRPLCLYGDRERGGFKMYVYLFVCVVWF